MGNRIGNRIQAVWRMRRQSDTVKIICLLVLTGCVFWIGMVYRIWEIYQYIDSPVEYILSGEDVVSRERMDEVIQSKDVSMVSRQIQIPVSIQYCGAETTVYCVMLSSEYMAERFGAEVPEGSSSIYMNPAAWNEFQEVTAGNRAAADGSGDEPDKASAAFTVRYSTGEDMTAVRGGKTGDAGAEIGPVAQSNRTARLIVVQTGGEEAESFIYMPETESRLVREGTDLRVRFEKHDLDGLHVRHLRTLGYEIENEEVIREEEHELQIKLLHIQYGLVIGAICMVGAWGCGTAKKGMLEFTKKTQ